MVAPIVLLAVGANLIRDNSTISNQESKIG
jgi:hypothetical protein